MQPENLSSSLESFSQWKYCGDTSTGPQEMACFGLWGPELGGCGHNVCPVTGELARPCGHILLLPKKKTWENLVVSLSLCICVGLGEGLLILHLDLRLEMLQRLWARSVGLGKGEVAGFVLITCPIN